MQMDDMVRTEERYLLDETAHAALKRELQSSPGMRYTVSDLYMSASGEAGGQGEIVRLRGYNVPKEGDCVYLEREMRLPGMTCKRRVGMTLSEAEQLIGAGEGAECQTAGQALREKDYVRHNGALTPTAMVSFEREAYTLANGARLTFDSGLRYRAKELSFAKGDAGEPLMEEGACIMALKGARPEQLRNLLLVCHATPVAFSKYGYAFMAAALKRRRS